MAETTADRTLERGYHRADPLSNCPHYVPHRLVPYTEGRMLGTVTPYKMQPTGGGYLSPVTSGDGYRLRLTPECLGLMLAIGQ